jgi:hypothetical protein
MFLLTIRTLHILDILLLCLVTKRNNVPLHSKAMDLSTSNFSPFVKVHPSLHNPSAGQLK